MKKLFLLIILFLSACSGEYDSTGYADSTLTVTPALEPVAIATVDVNLNSTNIRAVSTLIPHPNPDSALDGVSTVIPRPYSGWETSKKGGGMPVTIVEENKHVCDGVKGCRWCGKSVDGQYFLMGTPGPEKMPAELMWMCR